jgi:hypothetical protein
MADTTREITQGEWTSYFDELGRTNPAPTVTVEVDGAEIGAQVEAEPMTLAAISYDDRDDVLVIGLSTGEREQVEHLVYNPRQIYVAEGEAGTSTIDVEDSEGIKTLIELRPSS